jgi:Lsr2
MRAVRFKVDGTDYEIDLNTKNAAALQKKLAPFIEHARRAGRAPRRANARVIRHFGTHWTCQDLPCGAVDSRRIYWSKS